MTTDVFVEREFDLILKDGSKEQVILRIYHPEQQDSDEYACLCEIIGHRSLAFKKPIYGVDSMQSLVLCLQYANIRLSTCSVGKID